MPLERTARYRCLASEPLESLAVSSGEPEATVIAAGDLALHGADSFSAPTLLGDVADIWYEADARIANLETVCTSRTRPAATIGKSLRTSPAAVEFVKAAGLSAVTVANNHSLDFGSEGLAESVELLHRSGVPFCGASSAPGAPAAPALFSAKGIRIGMLGYCDTYRVPNEAVTMAPATASPEAIRSAITKLRSAVDVVIVQMHWGYEFSVHPLLRHREAARSFVDAGAQIVLCHHAHVPMGLERHGSGVIAHGLGNWLFPPSAHMAAGHEWTRRSFLLRFAIGRNGVHSVTAVPFASHQGPRVSLLRGRSRRFMLRALRRLSEAIGDTEWLRRAELCRSIFEAFNMLSPLADYPEEAFRQRIRIFRTPLNRELANSLVEIGGRPAALGRLMNDISESASDPAAVRRLLHNCHTSMQAGFADLRRLYRWQDAFLARIP